MLGESPLISALEAFAVLIARFTRDRRMTVLIVTAGVGTALALQIAAAGFHSIVKTTAMDVGALLRPHIPTAWFRHAHLLSRLGHLLFRSVREVRDGGIVAAAKAVAVSVPIVARNPGMTELLAAVHVRAALIVEIIARGFDSIVKAAALKFLEFLWRRIPAAAVLAVSGRWRSLRHTRGSGHAAQACGSQKQRKCQYCESIESHSSFIPLVEKIPQHSVLSKEKDTGRESARMPSFAQDRSFWTQMRVGLTVQDRGGKWRTRACREPMYLRLRELGL